MPGYRYGFSLAIVLYKTEQNKAVGVFIANLKLKNENMDDLADYYKTVPAFQYYKSSLLIQVKQCCI